MDKILVIILVVLIAIVAVIAILFLPQAGPTEDDKEREIVTKTLSLAPKSATAVGRVDVKNYLDRIAVEMENAGYYDQLTEAKSYLLQQSGIDIDDIDAIDYIAGDINKMEMAGVVTGGIDEDKFLSNLPTQYQEETYKGYTLHSAYGYQSMAYATLSDEKFIIGTPTLVKEIIDRMEGEGEGSFMDNPDMVEISNKLGSYPNYIYAVVTSEMKESLKRSVAPMAGPYNPYEFKEVPPALIDSLEAVALGDSAKGTKAVILCSDSASAAELANLLGDYLDKFSGAMSSAPPGSYNPMADFQNEIMDLMGDIEISSDGKFVVISTPADTSIVSVIVPVVIWQMGIFNPSSNTVYAPSQSTTPSVIGFGSVKPMDWICDSATDNLQVAFVNGAGESIVITPPDGGCTGLTGENDDTLSIGGQMTCTWIDEPGCAAATAGSRFESDISITWVSAAGGITHTETGLVARAAS